MWAIATPEALRVLGSLLYPPVCAICAADISDRQYLCRQCADEAPKLRAPFCEKCSQPFAGAIDGSFTCSNCAQRTLHFEAAVSAFRSRGVVRQLVHEFKYGRQLHLRHPLGEWLGETLDDPRLRGRRFDSIVPVPLHPTRERERGFNQADLLARSLSLRADVPVRRSLRRIRYTTTQTRHDRDERMENLRGAFRLRKRADVRNARVLLVDDILTTGSTLSECADVLKKAGALSVYAVTVARA